MEFTALEGVEIVKVETLEDSIVFCADIQGVEAKIEISGIDETFINDEKVEIIETLENSVLETIDIEVIDFEEDTFSQVDITTEDGNDLRLVGDMKGTILNIEDFQELLNEIKED